MYDQYGVNHRSCPHCGGTLTISCNGGCYHGMRTCVACGGYGVFHYPDGRSESCTVCQRRGQVHCPKCGGKGNVPCPYPH